MQARLSLQNLILALGASLLGLTLHLSGGMYAGFAVAMLAAVLCMFMSAAFGTNLCRPANIPAVPFLAGLLFLQLFAILLTPYGESLLDSPAEFHTVYITAIAISGGAAMLIAAGNGAAQRIGFALMLTCFGTIGVAIIRQTPAPLIDVHAMQQQAAEALIHGENPYAMTMPDIYGGSFKFYPPGAVQDGRVQFGYLYPPLSLLVTTPGYVLLGDVRYVYLACMLATGATLLFLRSDRVGMMLSALFLFTPGSFHLLRMAWTEPLAALLLAAVVVFAMKQSRVLPIALGLLLAGKQFLPAAVLLVPLLNQPNSRRLIVQSLLVATSVTLPFMLWNPAAFFHSALGYHLVAPFRPDSLNFVAWWSFQQPGFVPPSWLPFGAISLCSALFIWKSPRSPAAFSIAFAVCYLAFFGLSKQAFGNYYHLVLTAAYAAASIRLPLEVVETSVDAVVPQVLPRLEPS
jgi:hypothetical protein